MWQFAFPEAKDLNECNASDTSKDERYRITYRCEVKTNIQVPYRASQINYDSTPFTMFSSATITRVRAAAPSVEFPPMSLSFS